MSTELRELAESVFGDAWDNEASGFDSELWSTCEQTGLARLTLPEKAGGSGATMVEASTVLGAAGRFAARIPLAETDLAGWLLHTAGLEVPLGPLSVVASDAVELTGGRQQVRARGSLRRVAWGRDVAAVAVLTEDRVLLVDVAAATVSTGSNLAEEPRDDLTLEGVEVTSAALLGAEIRSQLRLRRAMSRSLLLAGAASAALDMALRYAAERLQFGRPLAKLQAVQQMLALAGAEVAAAAAATQAAAVEIDERGVESSWLAIAAAKARAGQAAGEVARITHQVHGAIGFTREHDLRLATTRLWAWRDEDGSEAEWNTEIGEHACAAGASGLWPLLAGHSEPS